VPNSAIYFWNAADNQGRQTLEVSALLLETLLIDGSRNDIESFTLVVKDADMRIVGDINITQGNTINGMYVVPDGDIIFGANPTEATCLYTQVVKGIYITNNNFQSEQLINNDP
jgi:hypothetical protein